MMRRKTAAQRDSVLAESAAGRGDVAMSDREYRERDSVVTRNAVVR